ncbi:MAG: tetratricopeptide repeat protein [Candidatus Bathyarchaeia archaeon]
MAFLKSAKTLTIDGIEHLNKKEYEKALKCFQRASKKKPRDVNILNFLSQAQTALGMIEEALVSVDKAIEYDPGNVIHWQLKATNLMMLQRHEEAIPVIERCMELQPGDVNYLMRGQVDYIIKDYASAGEWFDRALEIDPENPLSNHMKGLVLYNLGLYSEAISHLEKVLVVGASEAVQNILDDCKLRTREE